MLGNTQSPKGLEPSGLLTGISHSRSIVPEKSAFRTSAIVLSATISRADTTDRDCTSPVSNACIAAVSNDQSATETASILCATAAWAVACAACVALPRSWIIPKVEAITNTARLTNRTHFRILKTRTECLTKLIAISRARSRSCHFAQSQREKRPPNGINSRTLGRIHPIMPLWSSGNQWQSSEKKLLARADQRSGIDSKKRTVKSSTGIGRANK